MGCVGRPSVAASRSNCIFSRCVALHSEDLGVKRSPACSQQPMRRSHGAFPGWRCSLILWAGGLPPVGDWHWPTQSGGDADSAELRACGRDPMTIFRRHYRFSSNSTAIVPTRTWSGLSEWMEWRAQSGRPVGRDRIPHPRCHPEERLRVVGAQVEASLPSGMGSRFAIGNFLAPLSDGPRRASSRLPSGVAVANQCRGSCSCARL